MVCILLTRVWTCFTHDLSILLYFVEEVVVTTVVWYIIFMPFLVYISWKMHFRYTIILHSKHEPTKQIFPFSFVDVPYFQDIHFFELLDFSDFIYNINEEILFLAQLFIKKFWWYKKRSGILYRCLYCTFSS